MLQVLFPIMCTISDDDDDEEEMLENLAESNSPGNNAAQVVDILAISLPPEKYMSALMTHIQPALQVMSLIDWSEATSCITCLQGFLSSFQNPATSPNVMKGAFNALAVSAEGCSEHIRNKHLNSFLEVR